MRRYNLLRDAMILGISLGLLGSSQALADHHTKDKDAKKAPAASKEQKQDPNQQAAMEAWEKAGQPGPAHQRLKAMAGNFDTATKAWMEPGKPPEVSKGKSQNKLILGDRYLQQEYSGSMMGKPFNGLGMTGYDNVNKKYVSTWADTMGTMLMVMEGQADPAGKVITSKSEYTDAVSGKKVPQRIVTRIESDNKHVFEMYEPGPDGKERKTLEIVYTRAK